MNKEQLVQIISKQTKLTKVDTEKVLDAFISVVQSRVKLGEDVTLMGFGTFTSTKRKARKGFDPYHGKEIDIPSMTLPKFRPGKEFKKTLE